MVPSPNPDIFDYLFGVTAISANDVWAVGDEDVGNGSYVTLIEHWDGTSWSVVTSPSPGSCQVSYVPCNHLSGVTAVSASDVLAVGYYYIGNFVYHTLIEWWNGTKWKVMPSPSPGTSCSIENCNYLGGVAAVSASDVWADGYYYNSNNISHTLVEHYSL